MKIIYLNRKYNPNERSIERLFGFITSRVQQDGYTIETIENPYYYGLFNIIKSILYFRHKTSKEDIIHITGHIHFAAIGLKTKNIIITVHDLLTYRKLSRIRYFFYRLLFIYLPFKKAQIITVISQKTKNEIINIMPSVAHKIEVISNCTTLNIIPEIYLKKNIIPEVLIIGTRENKNINNAIKSLRDFNIHLTIIGNLNDEHLNNLAINKIAYNNFVNVDESTLLKIYEKADILLFVSTYEGFGLPILEAQAQNVLVITSNISPLNEVGGEGALYVDPYSITSIRNEIENILNFSEKEKLDLIKKGKKNINQYTIEDVSHKYEEIYEKIS